MAISDGGICDTIDPIPQVVNGAQECMAGRCACHEGGGAVGVGSNATVRYGE